MGGTLVAAPRWQVGHHFQASMSASSVARVRPQLEWAVVFARPKYAGFPGWGLCLPAGFRSQAGKEQST